MAVNWGEVFKGPTGAAAISAGATLAGGALAGSGAQKQSDAQIKENRRRDALTRQNELFDTQLGQENKDFSSQMADKRSLDQQTMGAMGTSPLAFQADRMRMNAIADALQAGGPSNLSAHMAPFARGMDMSKFRPSAAAEQPYWNQVAQASGGRFGGADLGSIYGGAAGQAADQVIGQTTANAGAEWQSDWDSHDAKTQETLRQAGISNDAELKAAVAEAQKQPGGSKWKILAKIGIIAGGAIATGMTGGLAAPLIIGALTGAGTGALDGGAKGALMGAGMGAAMGGLGGIGGAAKSAAGTSLGQATKQALSNPGTLLRMGGVATPGAAGAIMNTAGGLLEPRMTGKWGASKPVTIPNLPEATTPTTLPGNAGLLQPTRSFAGPAWEAPGSAAGVKGLNPATMPTKGTNFYGSTPKAAALKKAIAGGTAKSAGPTGPPSSARWGLDDNSSSSPSPATSLPPSNYAPGGMAGMPFPGSLMGTRSTAPSGPQSPDIGMMALIRSLLSQKSALQPRPSQPVPGPIGYDTSGRFGGGLSSSYYPGGG